jgi:hypothetical protein
LYIAKENKALTRRRKRSSAFALINKIPVGVKTPLVPSKRSRRSRKRMRQQRSPQAS